MFRRSDNTSSNAETVAILGDEQAAALHSMVEALAAQVVALEEQVRSQYTSMAAYVSIAKEQIEFARNEARADLDRTRSTLIELVEQVRAESTAPTPAPAPSPFDAPVFDAPARDPHVTSRLGEMERAVVRCLERQNELADTMTAILDATTIGTHETIDGLALI